MTDSTEVLPEELTGQGENHSDEHRADEAAPADDDHSGADPGAQELAHPHNDPLGKRDGPASQEEDEGDKVAREVHDLGVRSGAGEVEPEQENKGHGPEGSGAGPEKAVVEAESQSEQKVERSASHSAADVCLAELGREKHGEGYGNE